MMFLALPSFLVQTHISAMPVMVAVLCCMAIAYRYYSAFLAAKVAVLNDARTTPAVKYNDGQNYHPTNKWVLFGHHFAAISGAGPLIGPVLAAQFGYMPGLLWIVIGVCLAGAMQDFLVMAASLRRDGKSLAQIAFTDIGKTAGTAATIAILFILVIALAGLGRVVVEALGGKDTGFPAKSSLILPAGAVATPKDNVLEVPAGTTLSWNEGKSTAMFDEGFRVRASSFVTTGGAIALPAGAARLTPGSSWGVFTIAATIPIALFVGLYMYKIRPGRVIEASIIGGALTLAATFVGGWVHGHSIGRFFSLSVMQVTWAMAIYGFVASVLPVWVLLVPRDYLSSFLKIGTIGLLVIGVLVANPTLHAPPINHAFLGGGPVVGTSNSIFPFLFITIMCGAISGFHALVSSGTTPKMVRRESDARTIGYGAMLIEGLVGVVAMVAASTLDVRDYYAMNTDLAKVPAYNERILAVAGAGGIEHVGDYERLTQESLRGRTGGAVTLAVGMAHIFDEATRRFGAKAGTALDAMWKYWYHFAIMFEALFILTTIDAGTRIGRFLLQEALGKIHPRLAQTNWWPAAILSTVLIVAGWAYFMNSDQFSTIWALFGIANQMLAVIALAVVSCWLVNEGRARYLWVTALPMLFVLTTTSSAAAFLLSGQFEGIRTQLTNPSGPARSAALFASSLQACLILAMLTCTAIILAAGVRRVWNVVIKQEPARRGFEPVVVS